jgi:hypothetical protein
MIHFPKSLQNIKYYYAVVHSVSEASKKVKDLQSSIQVHQSKDKNKSKFS